jgi:hypothetical protein
LSLSLMQSGTERTALGSASYFPPCCKCNSSDYKKIGDNAIS